MALAIAILYYASRFRNKPVSDSADDTDKAHADSDCRDREKNNPNGVLYLDSDHACIGFGLVRIFDD